jgi:hypothetical protein
MGTMQYFLGNLGNIESSSQQAIQLRSIILSEKPETEIINEFKLFVLDQNQLLPDCVSIINKALMTHYGSEYLGLGKDDFSLKLNIYKQFIEQFPQIASFKFYYADCSLILGMSTEEFYPILKEGMLQDENNNNYPSADLFEFIQDSVFSFDFDILLLEKYYQPCSKECFDDWISDYKKQYDSPDQILVIESLKWKGDIPA